jgi:hypothetical protein
MVKRNIVQQAVKVYIVLLRLYPREHRREYGEWMAQLFRDQCTDAYAQRRALGLLALWLRTLWDLGITAFQEHLRLAADLGLANQKVAPLPWRQVLLAVLPGLWIMVERAQLIPWVLGWRWISYDLYNLPPGVAYPSSYKMLMLWLKLGWMGLACVLMMWRGWRNRPVACWVYPIAGVVVFGLPLTVLSIIFHQDGMTSLSPLGGLLMNKMLPLTFVAASLVVLGIQRRRIRASIITWGVVGLFIITGSGLGLMWIYIAILVAVPAALGLLAVAAGATERRDHLYTTMFVLGIVWWFVDAILDPSYGLLIWTDAHTAVRVISALPALFILVLPVIAVLRARTTHQQLAGLIVPPCVGVIFIEVGRFLLLSGTERGFTAWEWRIGLGSAAQIAAMLALVAITYAQLDGRSELSAER